MPGNQLDLTQSEGSSYKVIPGKCSKKHARFEAKKRKAAAFLQLVKEREADEQRRKEKEKPSCSTDNKDSDWSEKEAPPVKKMKLEPSEEEKHRSFVTKQKVSVISQDDSPETQTQQKTIKGLAEMRRQLRRQRQKASMEKPKVFLTLEELCHLNPVISQSDVPELPPLFMLDLQHLLLYAIQGNIASSKPRWCRLLRVGKVTSVVVFVLNKVCCTDLEEYQHCFSYLKENFSLFVEMISPAQYSSTVEQDVFHVPLSISQMKLKDFSSSERKVASIILRPPSFLAVDQSEEIVTTHSLDKFDRRCLLLNLSQMIKEGYPLPVKSDSVSDEYRDFVFSKDFYKTVSSTSPLFALDCEMCLTSAKTTELTRISVINENLETVYDTLVKPKNRIVDYLTKWSGITKAMLDPVRTMLYQVQHDLKRILPGDAILCGQSLNFDLMAVKLFHPYVIDTSIIFNLTGHPGKKTGLKRLTSYFLGRNIQENPSGHCSVEDAKATLELVLLKLRNGLAYGDVVMERLEFLRDKDGSQGVFDGNDRTKTSEGHERKTPNAQSYTPVKNQKDAMCSLQEKRRMFFQRQNDFTHQNFFKLVKDSNKTATLIGREDVTSQYDSSIGVTCVISDSDKTTSKAAKSHVKSEDFVWTNCHGFSDCLSEHGSHSNPDLIQESITKLDKMIKMVMKNVRTNSLACVVLTGRQHDDETVQNGGVFLKIT